MNQILLQGLKKLNFSDEKISQIEPKLNSYINEIILFNSAYNLTNTSVYDEIVINHILDSLSATEQIQKTANLILNNQNQQIKIADVGSGGGLPGIPLAIVLPEYNFTLIERMDKRCAFLENVIAILGLKNVTVLKKQAEKVTPDSFDIATFRAFRPLDKEMIKILLKIIKPNGFLTAYKAKEQNIKKEMQEISDIILEYQIKPLTVPFLTDKDSKNQHERNLVLIQKTC